MNNPNPNNQDVTVKELTRAFNSTAASYKFYWFISLLQLYSRQNGKQTINVTDILIQVICNAWYPVNYFRLSFGFSDLLQKNIKEIQGILNIPIDVTQSELFKILKSTQNPKIKKLISHFSLQVPYRFLSPWIKYKSDNDTIERSQGFQQNCIYRILKEEELKIEINPKWESYIKTNFKILLDFAYWKLVIYVQKNNMNVPNVSLKLIKPNVRENLSKQRQFWDIAFDDLGSINCIYTQKELTKDHYDMEHFVPWSFVTHNQIWNLIPADGSINSSKSNKLPSLNKYLKSFVEVQRMAIKIVYSKSPNHKQLEDFLFLAPTIAEILDLSELKLLEGFENTINPLIQIASNSGFEYWKR